MHALAILMLVAGQNAPAPAQPTVQVYQDKIVVQRGSETFTQPLGVAPEKANPGKFRKGRRFAVWDERGLSMRDGDWLYTTRLRDIALTPKLFESEEIRETLDLVKEGQRSLDASALSGAGRVGDNCYFLVRWIAKSGKPWLEALVKVDLALNKPKPQLIGRFEGFSLAEGPVDDRLFTMGRNPAALTKMEDEWGLASYDAEAAAFSFAKLGERLRAHAIRSVKSAVYVEAMDYGMLRMGLVEFSTGWRRDLFEARGHLRILDTQEPLFAVVGSSDRSTVRNVSDGSQAEFPAGTAYVRTPLGILAWWPRQKPTSAVLLEPKRMQRLASWSGPPGLEAKQPSASLPQAPAKASRGQAARAPSGRP